MNNQLPTTKEFMNPILDALFTLGGSGSVDEIYEKVMGQYGIDAEGGAPFPNLENVNQFEILGRLAWARTYLKKYGFLENANRGIWTLTKLAKEKKHVEGRAVIRNVRKADKDAHINKETKKNKESQGWKEELHKLLDKEMSPDAFERLMHRLLIESGIAQVEVIGRTVDGWITGKGIAELRGFMSFPVTFQCKRGQGSVSDSEIMHFRSAMAVGNSNRGLFITTGEFTSAATKEASHDGAALIDLIDMDKLAEKLKELHLGLKTEVTTTVDREWFAQL